MRHVKSLVRLDGLLTKDQIYTVIHEGKGFLTVVDDRGVQCAYSAARFEAILAPQVAPDFRQMQQIADEVKVTQPTSDEGKTIMQVYEETDIDTNKIVCPVVTEAEKRKAMIELKNAMLDGDLTVQLTARREIALQDCDANLAALLYRANDRIKELEDSLVEMQDRHEASKQ